MAESMKIPGNDGETFLLDLGNGVQRELPLRMLQGSDKRIASFVMLGDVELNRDCASLLVKKMSDEGLLEKFDYIVSLEAKGITLAHEIAEILKHPRFVVLRKSHKKYMQNPVMVPSESITSGGQQVFVIDGIDIERVRGRKVCLVEDVVATGGSINAACHLIETVGGEVTVIAAVLLKGTYDDPRLIYLAEPEL